MRAEVANFQPPEEDIEIFEMATGAKVGLGEVKAQLDEKSEAFSTEIIKRGRTITEIQDADGIWDVRVKTRFHFQNSLKDLERICEYAVRANIALDLRSQNSGVDDEISNAMKKHGIVSIQRIGQASPAKIFLHVESKGGFIPDEVTGIQDWLNEHKDIYSNSIKRLSSSSLSQRHLFLWLSDATPSEIRDPARFHPGRLPSIEPKGIDFLTHLWLGLSISQDGECIAWLFEPNRGWQLVTSNQMAFLKTL